MEFGGSLTAEQIEFYNSQGYCILENLLTEKDLEACREAMTQKVDQIAADLLANGKVSDVLALQAVGGGKVGCDIPVERYIHRLRGNEAE